MIDAQNETSTSLPTAEPAPATRRYDDLIALTQNPADRLWRYPLCHLAVRWFVRTPLTPTHVTLFHTALALVGAGLIARGTPRSMLAGGLLFELRAILDCFDGVLARAKKLSSRYGRALDQTGDSIAFVALMVASAIAMSRAHGAASSVALVMLTTALCGVGSACWDFYRRRFGSLLEQGRDEVEDEYVALCVDYAKHGGPALFMSWVASSYAQFFFNSANLPRLRERAARGDTGSSERHDDDALVRSLREAADRDDPTLRGAFLRVGAVGGDTGFFLIAVGAGLGQLTFAYLACCAYFVAMSLHTAAVCNRLLQPSGQRAHAAWH